MIIVSQDKYNVLNFNTTVNIGLEEISTLNDIVQVTAETNGNAVVLGKYKNEERAKEVLEDMVTTRAIFEIYKCSDTDIQCMFDKRMLEENMTFDTYEMPEE